MPDENRFSGLGDAVDDDLEDVSADEATTTEETAASETTAAGEAAGENADVEVDANAEADTEGQESATAAFPFDATTKNTFYVREPTLERLQDTEAVVDARLRTEHGVRNLTGREFHDAVLRVAADRPEDLIDTIIDSRGGTVSDDD